MGIKNQQGHGSKDASHDERVQDYRDAGCSVFDLSGCGGGCPDFMVGLVGRTELVEVKEADGKLNAKQEVFIRDWRGSRVHVVRTRDDVMAHISAVRRKVAAGSVAPPNGEWQN